MKVLHVAAEVFPLVKTGGLADVVAALPVAQAVQGADVRLLLPGYPAVLDAVQGARTVIDIGTCFGARGTRSGMGPGSSLRATRGEGGARLRIKTMSGDIEVCDR